MDDGCFSNNNTGSMIDHERATDRRPGMYVNAREHVRVLRDHSRHNGYLVFIKPMGQAVDGNSHEAGIRYNYFVDASGCRISSEKRFRILF
jgi:hypothetical protein